MANGTGRKLKRCPFCGKRVATVVDQYELNDYHDNEDAVRMYTVVCDGDKGGCGATCGFRRNEELAELFWNSRW